MCVLGALPDKPPAIGILVIKNIDGEDISCSQSRIVVKTQILTKPVDYQRFRYKKVPKKGKVC